MACETVYFYEKLLDGDSIYKSAKSIRASHYLVGNGKNNYIYPNKELHKNLEAIFGSKAVELKVTLNLENHPVCLDGEGNSPPEDVGGESGYEEFLEIIADEKHLEHLNRIEWGKMQGYKVFDMEMVNRMLTDNM